MLYTIEDVNDFFSDRDKLGIKPGLDRVQFLLEKLDHPEKRLNIIHVAGTNGKGSTIQFMSEALQRNNYSVGVFTSPSFIGIGGHFIINNEAAQSTTIIELINDILPFIKELDMKGDSPTTFEIITVMAFHYFVEKVDIAIIETGMGGRYDTTNCFIPILSVITTISMDHMQFLGNTLTKIAWHKAGIIKEHSPVVLGKIDDTGSLEVFRKVSDEKHTKLYRFGKEYNVTYERGLIYWERIGTPRIPFVLQMEGIHQIENAAVAWMGLSLLRDQGYLLSDKQMIEGFYETRLPGRFEMISQSPLLILDSAHNVAGIDSFLDVLQQKFQKQKKIVLFAGFKDKQLELMLIKLLEKVDCLIVTTFDHPRAADATMLKNIPGFHRAKYSEDWKKFIDQIEINDKEEVVYAITGSLHFITEVRRYVKGEE